MTNVIRFRYLGPLALSSALAIVYSRSRKPEPDASQPGRVLVKLFLEYLHDPDQLCHEERISQQTAQHPDRLEHLVFAHPAHAHDDDLARVLYRQGERRVSAAAGDAPSRVATNFIPGYYREKIRTIPGVVAVVPNSWFGGKYKDAKPENFFAQFGTDPDEFFKVFTDFKIPDDQLAAWQRDQAGVVVDSKLAEKFGWKVGDRINLKGTIYPTNLELTIRGIFTAPQPTQSVYFNFKYVEEAVRVGEGAGWNVRDPRGLGGERSQGGVCGRRDVPQFSATHKDGKRKGISAWFRGKFGQREGVHPEYLPGGCIRYACWSLRTPWPCRFASVPAKLRC